MKRAIHGSVRMTAAEVRSRYGRELVNLKDEVRVVCWTRAECRCARMSLALRVFLYLFLVFVFVFVGPMGVFEHVFQRE